MNELEQLKENLKNYQKAKKEVIKSVVVLIIPILWVTMSLSGTIIGCIDTLRETGISQIMSLALAVISSAVFLPFVICLTFGIMDLVDDVKELKRIKGEIKL